MSENGCIDNQLELETYLTIIDFFQNEKKDRPNTELWKTKLLIKLMKCLERPQNKIVVRNAIILLISLFERIPPDIYNNRGVDTGLIAARDKAPIISLLKKEVLSS